MRGAEVLRYIGNTARELSGFGEAQRAFQERKLQIANGNNTDIPGLPLVSAVANGALHVAFPFYFRALREDEFVGKKSTTLKYHLDVMSPLQLLLLAGVGPSEGLGAVFAAKVGYNLIAEVAPDVAKLVKSRVPHIRNTRKN